MWASPAVCADRMQDGACGGVMTEILPTYGQASVSCVVCQKRISLYSETSCWFSLEVVDNHPSASRTNNTGRRQSCPSRPCPLLTPARQAAAAGLAVRATCYGRHLGNACDDSFGKGLDSTRAGPVGRGKPSLNFPLSGSRALGALLR